MSPLAALAQQPKRAHLGWLTTAPAGDVSPFLDALRAGLAPQGYVEGRNLTISARYADGDISRVPALAEELAKLPVDVIATQGTATRLLIGTSATVPVVYVFSADPVLAGLAESLARPGRRMTGITLLSAELNGKRLELLREIVPKIGRVAILASPTHAGEELERKNSIEMADKLGIAIQYYPTPTTEALRASFARMTVDTAAGAGGIPGPNHLYQPSANRRFRERPSCSRDFGLGRFRRRRRALHLWPQACRVLSAAGLLCRSRPEGRQSRRIADRAADRV